MLYGEDLFFVTIVFRDHQESYEKTDGNGVLAGGPPDFLAAQLLIGS